ncbi:hypothetical protein [Acidiphilium multivorum]|uniref:hypothetical protein n=1 Tax=Acidiphilium multivorum TaxID=62140 RepID=UPI001B8CF165|nr:hypothetical protein [Acidiphilium multivorum]
MQKIQVLGAWLEQRPQPILSGAVELFGGLSGERASSDRPEIFLMNELAQKEQNFRAGIGMIFGENVFEQRYREWIR